MNIWRQRWSSRLPVRLSEFALLLFRPHSCIYKLDFVLNVVFLSHRIYRTDVVSIILLHLVLLSLWLQYFFLLLILLPMELATLREYTQEESFAQLTLNWESVNVTDEIVSLLVVVRVIKGVDIRRGRGVNLGEALFLISQYSPLLLCKEEC